MMRAGTGPEKASTKSISPSPYQPSMTSSIVRRMRGRISAIARAANRRENGARRRRCTSPSAVSML
jgi:hypothetical protein